MTKLLNRKLIFAGFFLIGGLLIYLAIETYQNLLLYQADNNRLFHTQQVIEANAQILSSLKDAETGQRGFLLTGNVEFLEPYNVGKVNYLKQIARVKQLTTDNAVQQSCIDSMARLGTNRLRSLDSTINKKRQAGAGFTAPVFILKAGKKVMDSIRRISAQINSREEAVLLTRQQQSFNNARTMQSLFFMSIVIAALLLISVFYYLIRQINKTTRTQTALYNSNEWFTQTLISLGDGVVATSPDHKITFMNKAAEKLTLFKAAEVLSLPIETVINIKNENTGLPVLVPTRRAIAENCVVELENHTVLIRRDGSEFYIDDSAAPVYDMHDNLLGAVLIFRDITEKAIISRQLKKLNEELEAKVAERTMELDGEVQVRSKAEKEKTKLIEQLVETNKSLEQFIYIISHNFRRPVANIIGLLNLFELDQDNERENTTLNYLSNEINHLDMVLKDLGAITTIRKNQAESKENIALLPLMQVIMESLDYEIIKIDAHIDVNITADNKVLGIKTYLNSILLNLLNNAIKYKNPDKKLLITIGFKSTATHNIIIVTDNGLGIDLDKHGAKLFGLYNRFHEHIDGKGLGLHISKTQMEMMGGFIEVESTPGVGTSFYLNFLKERKAEA